ncbi:MAG: DUF3617 family protein [Gammaproteobacteria bacterium]|nr:DUF3617 family protein [Gammaproteobacteria bacterium]MBU1440613.1 DUF3617 family protein [Gammaproteobacteria bacterium]MBU2287806.1 DUF3617 family protein [Gammaproteobacteria bacterium]MBU2409438.1 DUF3617 family protein [Gammaproteobacteria bacterium]
MKSRLAPLSAALAALVPACCAFAADAPDYPARKPGLWEISVQSAAASAKAPARATQQCIDAASDKAMREMGSTAGPSTCSSNSLRKEAGNLVIDSVCKIGASTATTHSVVSGDFGSNYRMESRSTYSPPLAGLAEGTAIVEAKWIGPCQADQKPGDMILPGGMKMNVLDLMKNRK